MKLPEAQAQLLSAYQALEQAQQQSHAIAQHLRNCELAKVRAEACVEALTPKDR